MKRSSALSVSMTPSETTLSPLSPPGDLGQSAPVDHGAELKRGAWTNLIAMLASNFRGIFTFLMARLLGPAALGIFSSRGPRPIS